MVAVSKCFDCSGLLQAQNYGIRDKIYNAYNRFTFSTDIVSTNVCYIVHNWSFLLSLDHLVYNWKTTGSDKKREIGLDDTHTSGWYAVSRFVLRWLCGTRWLSRRTACPTCCLSQYQCRVNLSPEAASWKPKKPSAMNKVKPLICVHYRDHIVLVTGTGEPFVYRYTNYNPKLRFRVRKGKQRLIGKKKTVPLRNTPQPMKPSRILHNLQQV